MGGTFTRTLDIFFLEKRRMCLELLDPCKICKFTYYVLMISILLFIGGYIGKGVYLHANMEDTGDVALHDILIDKNFWIPDGYFWVFGIAFIVLLFVGVCVFRGLVMGLAWLLKFLFCRLCCKSDTSDLDIESLDVKGSRYSKVMEEDTTKEG